MAACRFLNVLLGLSALPDGVVTFEIRIHLAGVVGLYIIGVTWFARTEEGRSSPRHLLAASTVLLLSLVAALALKARLSAGSGTAAFPYLLVLFGFIVGRPAARAVTSPGPREVQIAVKRCILGLVGLDAVLATAFIGLPGLAILLLLPPALLLGKWVYST
jgi:4-hydroxybenzoate polyprenyltransferase